MVIVRGVALAGSGSSLRVHLPSAPAVAVLVWPANVTVTVVPAASQPQIGSACCCWSTMWSPMIVGSFNSPRAIGVNASSTGSTNRCFLIGMAMSLQKYGGLKTLFHQSGSRVVQTGAG